MPDNSISIISISISVLALVIALFDFFVSRRALKISEIKQNERKPNLIPYLINGFCLTTNSERLFAFYFSVTNRSSNKNSITRLDLKIVYNDENHNRLNLILQHDNKFKQSIDLPGHAPFSIPVEISAYQTISGWCLFEVNEMIFDNKTIEGYVIMIRDSHDIECTLNPILIPERLINEKKMAQ